MSGFYCFRLVIARCAAEHANAKLARPRINRSRNLVVTVLLHENLAVGEALGQERCSLLNQCFPRQWACACFLLLAGRQRPRKGHETPPIMLLTLFTKIPRKTHENRPRARKCFERNDSEPRKPHGNSTKSPRKLHQFKNSGSLARPWTVVRDLRFLWNFGHQTCARGAKNTR